MERDALRVMLKPLFMKANRIKVFNFVSISTSVRFGLMGIASRFGLKPAEFGENLKDGYQKVDPRQDPVDPMEAAADYVGEKITKPEDVITAAKNLMAAQIAHEPLVRKETREAFFDRATISVIPTKKVTFHIGQLHCKGCAFSTYASMGHRITQNYV